MDTMNILLSCTNEFAKYLPPLMVSLYENHKDIKVDIYIIHFRIENDMLNVFREISKQYNQESLIIKLDEKDIAYYYQTFSVDNRWPIENSIYLLAHKILPESVDRIFYIDSDVIITGRIYDYYLTDFMDKYLVVFSNAIENTFKKREEFDLDQARKGLLWSGCLTIVNVSKFRNDNIDQDFYCYYINECKRNFSEFEYFAGAKTEKQYFFSDQGLANYIFCDKAVYLKYIDKAIMTVSGVAHLKLNKLLPIIHFGPYKPWVYNFSSDWCSISLPRDPEKYPLYMNKWTIKCFEEWWKYAKLTTLYDCYYDSVKGSVSVWKRMLPLIKMYNNNIDYIDELNFRLNNFISENKQDAIILNINFPECQINKSVLYNTEAWDVRNTENGCMFRKRLWIEEQYIKFPFLYRLQGGSKIRITCKIFGMQNTDKRIQFSLYDTENNKSQIIDDLIIKNEITDYTVEVLTEKMVFSCLRFDNKNLEVGNSVIIKSLCVEKIEPQEH